jgi:hypothetical protein
MQDKSLSATKTVFNSTVTALKHLPVPGRGIPMKPGFNKVKVKVFLTCKKKGLGENGFNLLYLNIIGRDIVAGIRFLVEQNRFYRPIMPKPNH